MHSSSQLRHRLVKKKVKEKEKGAITALTATQNLTFKYPWLDKHTRSHFMEDFTLSFLSGKEKNTIIDRHYCYYCYISFACEL